MTHQRLKRRRIIVACRNRPESCRASPLAKKANGNPAEELLAAHVIVGHGLHRAKFCRGRSIACAALLKWLHAVRIRPGVVRIKKMTAGYLAAAAAAKTRGPV
jgi:hypothetical protein